MSQRGETVINRFSDHAANERTYLAWIRTAIAIMAFGFVVEKFDLFLKYLGHNVTGTGKQSLNSAPAEIVGLAFIFISIIIFILSTTRYFAHKEAIQSETLVDYGSKRTNILIGLLMILLTIFLLFYMSHQIFTLWSMA